MSHLGEMVRRSVTWVKAEGGNEEEDEREMGGESKMGVCTTHRDIPRAVEAKNTSLMSNGKRREWYMVRVWHHSGRAQLARTTGSWICCITLFLSFLLWNSSSETSNPASPSVGCVRVCVCVCVCV